MLFFYLFQVKGLVAKLIKVNDLSNATALEVAAGTKVNKITLQDYTQLMSFIELYERAILRESSEEAKMFL